MSMATTPLTLVFLGTLALIATLGLFYEFDDPYTGVLVAFVAAVLWGFFALGAMDVVVYESAAPEDAGASLDVLVWTGTGLSLLSVLFAVNDLLHALGGEAESTRPDDFARP